MAWWGLLVTVGWTAQHFAVNGMIGDGSTIFGIIWGSFSIVGLLGQLLLARSHAGQGGRRLGRQPRLAGRSGAPAPARSSRWWSASRCSPQDVGYRRVRLDRAGRLRRSMPVALIVTGTLAGDRIARDRRLSARWRWSACSPLSSSHPDRYLIAAAGRRGDRAAARPAAARARAQGAGLSSVGEDSPFDHNAIDDVIHGRIRLGVVAYLSAVEIGSVLRAARQGRRHRRQSLGAPQEARGCRLCRGREELREPQAADPALAHRTRAARPGRRG